MISALRARGLALAFVFVAALTIGSGAAVAEPTFPPLTGRVVDNAHILSPQVAAQLDEKLAALEQSTHHQLVVATLPSLQGYEIEDYGYQLGRAWKLGRAGSNDGALFIVAPAEHKVRIEVGYGLEPVLTDAMSSLILQRSVLPKFKAGDIPGGVVAGTDAIISQLALPEEEAKANVAAAAAAAAATAKAKPVRHRSNGLSFLPVLFIFLFVMSMIGRSRRRRGLSSGIAGGVAEGLSSALPWMILGALSNGGRRDDWGGGGGGGWGGGGGGGGGFSGGGGSFGGGGSSGSW